MILSNFLTTLCHEPGLVFDWEIVQDPAKLPVSCYQKMQIENERLENGSEQDRKQRNASRVRRQRGGSITRWDCYAENAIAAAHKKAIICVPLRRKSLNGSESTSSSSTTANPRAKPEEQQYHQQQKGEQEQHQQQYDTLPRRSARRASNDGCQRLDRLCSWASSA